MKLVDDVQDVQMCPEGNTLGVPREHGQCKR